MPRHKKKFIDKKNATTFQIVHRSQKDPLAADEDAPQHVLLPMDANFNINDAVKHESATKREERLSKQREFGIAFDDDYNYFQHLREVDDEVAVLVPHEDPVKAGSKTVSFGFPEEVFASGYEEEVGMLHRAIPPVGPQVDWDPDIVAALTEDFDYNNPENELGDDFLIVADIVNQNESGSECDYGSESYGSNGSSFEHDFDEEETKSRFTNYSMSSAVIPRSKHFETLDDQFEKFYEMYDDENLGGIAQEDIDGNVQVENADESEIVANLLGLTKILTRTTEFDEKLPKEYYKETLEKVDSDDSDNEEDLIVIEKEEMDKKWDCESIISTYSNIYNHPKFIDEIPKPIKLTRSGIAMEGLKKKGITARDLKQLNKENEILDTNLRTISESNSVDDASVVSNNVRRKEETKEEKAMRKQAVKAAKRERRVEKKATKTAFSQERMRQKKELLNIQTNMNGMKIL